jgi:hypothetical protein
VLQDVPDDLPRVVVVLGDDDADAGEVGHVG